MSEIPTSGLVFYFNCNTDLDAASTGQGAYYNGVNVEDVEITTPSGVTKIIKAFRFLYPYAFVGFTGSGLPNEDNPRTLSCWVKRNAPYEGTEATFLGYGSGGGSQSCDFFLGSQGRFGIDRYGLQSFTPVNSIDHTKFNHVAVTYENGALSFYLNGNLIETVSYAFNSTSGSGSLMIGCGPSQEWFFTDGSEEALVAQPRIYDWKLNVDDIKALYNELDPVEPDPDEPTDKNKLTIIPPPECCFWFNPSDVKNGDSGGVDRVNNLEINGLMNVSLIDDANFIEMTSSGLTANDSEVLNHEGSYHIFSVVRFENAWGDYPQIVQKGTESSGIYPTQYQQAFNPDLKQYCYFGPAAGSPNLVAAKNGYVGMAVLYETKIDSKDNISYGQLLRSGIVTDVKEVDGITPQTTSNLKLAVSGTNNLYVGDIFICNKAPSQNSIKSIRQYLSIKYGVMAQIPDVITVEKGPTIAIIPSTNVPAKGTFGIYYPASKLFVPGAQPVNIPGLSGIPGSLLEFVALHKNWNLVNNDVDGTLFGSSNWANGALVLDASSYVQYPMLFSGNDPRTIVFTARVGSSGAIIGAGTSGSNSGDWTLVSGISSLMLNGWYNDHQLFSGVNWSGFLTVAVVFDGVFLSCYVQAADNQTYGTSTNFTTIEANFYMGAAPNTNQGKFTGSFLTLRVWKKALSTSELNTAFAADKSVITYIENNPS